MNRLTMIKTLLPDTPELPDGVKDFRKNMSAKLKSLKNRSKKEGDEEMKEGEEEDYIKDDDNNDQEENQKGGSGEAADPEVKDGNATAEASPTKDDNKKKEPPPPPPPPSDEEKWEHEAKREFGLGKISLKNKEINEALEAFQNALELRKKVYKDQPHARLAETYEKMGDIMTFEEKYEEALEWYEKARDMFDDLIGIEALAQNEYRINYGGEISEAKEQKFAEKLADKKAAMMNTVASIGDVYYMMRQNGKALKNYELAIKPIEEVNGWDALEVADLYTNMARICMEDGNIEKALHFYRHAIAAKRNALGEDKSEYALLNYENAVAYEKLGDEYYSQGNESKASEAYRFAKIALELTLPVQYARKDEEASNLANTYFHLGYILSHLDEKQKALDCFSDALKTTKSLGKEPTLSDEKNQHIKKRLTILREQIGILLFKLGDCRKAIPYLEEAIRALQQTEKGERLSKLMQYLADSQVYLRRFADAADSYRKAIKYQQAAKGEKHESVAIIIKQLASVFVHMQRYKEATKLFEHALHIKFEPMILLNLADVYFDLGAQHRALGCYKAVMDFKNELDQTLDLSIPVGRMGQIYYELGDYSSSCSKYKEAVEMKMAMNDDDDEGVSNFLNNLGNVYVSLCDFDEANKVYKSSLSIRENYFGSEAYEIVGVLVNLGIVNSKLQKMSTTIEFLERARKILDSKIESEEDLLQLADIFCLESDAQLKLRHFDDARGCLSNALEIRHKCLDSKDELVSLCYYKLAIIFYQEGNYEKCLQFLNINSFAGVDDEIKAKTLHTLGNVYMSTSPPDFKRSLEYYHQALEVKEVVYGKYHRSIARTLRNIGISYKEIGELEDARVFLSRALEVFLETEGKDCPETNETLIDLGKSYLSFGDEVTALECFQTAEERFKSMDLPENDFRLRQIRSRISKLQQNYFDSKHSPPSLPLLSTSLLS